MSGLQRTGEEVKICTECGGDYDPHINSRERTALQKAVLWAAVEERLTRPLLEEGVWDWTPDSEQKRLDAAVDALLAVELAWGEGK